MDIQNTDNLNVETLEVDLLCQALFEAFGYDFRNYARASLKRRLRQFIQERNIPTISHLTADLLHDRNLLASFFQAVSVTTSEMFRDPPVFRYLREKVIPFLNTFPHIRIWHAACAGGEEVFSLAILLKEEGLYNKCSIYATDMNEEVLRKVQQRIFPIKSMKEYSVNYQASGGKGSLSDFYHAKYDHVIFNKDLLEKVTFSNHNLTTDGVFLEAHLILCRNVMIYFDSELQNRVLQLLSQSLINGGILCLGLGESLQFSPVESFYSPMEPRLKIFKKEHSHG